MSCLWMIINLVSTLEPVCDQSGLRERHLSFMELLYPLLICLAHSSQVFDIKCRFSQRPLWIKAQKTKSHSHTHTGVTGAGCDSFYFFLLRISYRIILNKHKNKPAESWVFTMNSQTKFSFILVRREMAAQAHTGMMHLVGSHTLSSHFLMANSIKLTYRFQSWFTTVIKRKRFICQILRQKCWI